MTFRPVDSADQIVAAFRARYGRAPEIVVRAPGRVNLLGAHVDYNEGWVLPGAIERRVWLAGARRADRRLELAAINLDAAGALELGALPPPVPARSGEDGPGVGAAAVSWSDYPAAVAWSLAQAGFDPGGMDVAYGGNLPMASGVSSSAALEMAFVLAWTELWDLALGRGEERALVGQRAENGYIGVRSGIMDQYASVFGRRDHLVLIDCRSLEHRLVELPPRARVLVADSGSTRTLAGSDFNRRRDEAERAAAFFAERVPGVRALRDVTQPDLGRFEAELPPDLARRARHVVEECGRVHEGVAALDRGEIDSFGRLVRASHESSRDLYEVSTPELDLLAETAWASPGCHGARLTGAGFGGCVTALVDVDAVEATSERLTSAFVEAFDRRPTLFSSRLADGAAVV